MQQNIVDFAAARDQRDAALIAEIVAGIETQTAALADEFEAIVIASAAGVWRSGDLLAVAEALDQIDQILAALADGIVHEVRASWIEFAGLIETIRFRVLAETVRHFHHVRHDGSHPDLLDRLDQALAGLAEPMQSIAKLTSAAA